MVIKKIFKIPEGKIIAFDTETTGVDRNSLPYCFSFCNEKGETTVFSFPVDPKTRKVTYFSVGNANSNVNIYALPFNILQAFFEDVTITKIAHNAQFDVRMCEQAGIKVKGPVICTMNLIRLIKSDAPMKLKVFCEKYLGIGVDDETELKEAVRKARRDGKTKGYTLYQGKDGGDGALASDYWLAPRPVVERYAVTDAQRAMAVYLSLSPEIKKQGMEKLWDQEQKTWQALRQIEKRGIRVFPEKIKEQLNELKKKLLTYQSQAQKITGKKINLRSSLQLRKIFYAQLKESPKYWTPSGLPSTDTDALRAMQHPLSKTILNIRACHKTIEFMDQYKNFMVPEKNYWVIHPTIHQAMTITGRESCRDPNLQQVGSGRTDKGTEVLVEARSVFGSRPGYQMRSYDWKNIEVFIPAFASGEENLIKVLREGGDVHQNTANSLSKLLEYRIERDTAKRIFFGLLYGIGSKKLAKLLSLETNVSAFIVHGFKKQYPTLTQWMEGLKIEAITKGHVTTAYGRIIHVSSEEAYKASNYYVQGTAGGILRTAKIKISEWIEKTKTKAAIVLPIHDELLIEVQTEYIESFDRRVVKSMQDNPELKMPIPIPVSVSAIGKSWADKKKIKTI